MNSLELSFQQTFGHLAYGQFKGNFGTKYDTSLANFLRKSKVDREGVSVHRYKDNPREKQWALFFDDWCTRNASRPRRGSLDWLLNREASESEFKVAASVFQQMGSQVGHYDLIQFLCTLPEEDKKDIVKQLQAAIECQENRQVRA